MLHYVVIGAVDVILSFVGSMLAWVVWGHFELEAHLQQRRVRHGEKLDTAAYIQKARERRGDYD